MKFPVRVFGDILRKGVLHVGIYLTVGGFLAGVLEGADPPTAMKVAAFGAMLIFGASLGLPEQYKWTKKRIIFSVIAVIIAASIAFGLVYYGDTQPPTAETTTGEKP